MECLKIGHDCIVSSRYVFAGRDHVSVLPSADETPLLNKQVICFVPPVAVWRVESL